MPTTAKRGFTAGLTTKMQALASGALNNWLRNAVVLMAVIILIVLTVIVFRKKRADRTEYRSTSNKAALRSRHKEAAASPAGRPAKAVATRAKAAMPKVRPATIRSVQKTLTAPLKKTSGGHVLNAAKHMPNNTMAAAPRPNPTTRGSFLAKKHPRPHK